MHTDGQGQWFCLSGRSAARSASNKWLDTAEQSCQAQIMRLITEHQPGSRLGDFLQNGLKSDATSFRGAVAFVRASGMAHLKPLISSFSATRQFDLIVGVDLQGTSVEGLTMLDESLGQHGKAYIFHNSGSNTFHPKLFSFQYSNRTEVYIGSGNLTSGGLFTNHEAGISLSLAGSVPETEFLQQVHSALDAWSINGGPSARLLNLALIDELAARGLIIPEARARALTASSRATLASSTANGTIGTPLFGVVPVPAAPAPLALVSSTVQDSDKVATQIPAAPAAAAAPAAPASPATASPASAVAAPPNLGKVERAFWIETRRMTGGSRNILDLSMRCLVHRGNPKGTIFDIGEPGFMSGAVAFFGLDPKDTAALRDVVLRYEGTDYSGNSILFPAGSNANGTWRLQIKGLSSSGIKITDAFKSTGEDHLLVNKIILFEKIGADHYNLFVLSDGDIGRLQASSTILGFNGSSTTARRVGFL